MCLPGPALQPPVRHRRLPHVFARRRLIPDHACHRPWPGSFSCAPPSSTRFRRREAAYKSAPESAGLRPVLARSESVSRRSPSKPHGPIRPCRIRRCVVIASHWALPWSPVTPPPRQRRRQERQRRGAGRSVALLLGDIQQADVGGVLHGIQSSPRPRPCRRRPRALTWARSSWPCDHLGEPARSGGRATLHMRPLRGRRNLRQTR